MNITSSLANTNKLVCLELRQVKEKQIEDLTKQKEGELMQ